jgi:hypothetical protein
MLRLLRIPLRLAAVVAVGVAAYLVVLQPTATVASESLLSKVSIGVKCSSALDQWTNHAKPAALVLNGQPLASVPPAQSSCASASSTIKRIAGGLAVGGVLAFGVSLLRRRPRTT